MKWSLKLILNNTKKGNKHNAARGGQQKSRGDGGHWNAGGAGELCVREKNIWQGQQKELWKGTKKERRILGRWGGGQGTRTELQRGKRMQMLEGILELTKVCECCLKGRAASSKVQC